MLRGALCLAPTSGVPAFEQPKRWCPPGSAVYRADRCGFCGEGDSAARLSCGLPTLPVWWQHPMSA